ncbi:GNAT family N-acetyltransferase [Paenibacillus sp. 481]|uniref:GNAT family N-acetyltransferase n=1 Tax=Paenibacillus sp. 481 TaxID=2835869 RepID=UPI001E3C516A|nr:GNAT family N-acetyltransferase [Paenibacillus sp. 481]UHA72755.1 GNAT family N-acetyltransferase [Paenibacillus sp. 481]
MHIRPARLEDANLIATVQVQSWRTTYKNIVADDYLQKLSVEKRREIWEKIISQLDEQNVLFVAEDESGSIVGFASGGPNREQEYPYDCELYAIYLLEQVQGKGIGRALLHTFAQAMLSRHMTSMLVWVLKDNPALHFYKKLGGTAIDDKEVEIGSKMVKELSIGWHNLHGIVSHTEGDAIRISNKC